MDKAKVDQLKEFLNSADDWEKMKVDDGILIVKMPATKKFKAKLGVEVIPVSEDGTAIKKKGLYVLTKDVLEAFRRVFNSNKLDTLLSGIEEVNSTKTTESKAEGKVTGTFEL